MKLRRMLGRCAGVALGAALVAPWAHAQVTDVSRHEHAQSKRIAIDPATGRARPVEHDDNGALRASPAARMAAARSAMARMKDQSVVSTRGVRGMRLSPEHLNFTRVERQPDGTLSATCQVGESAEAHARHAAIVGAAQPVSVVRLPARAPQGAADVE